MLRLLHVGQCFIGFKYGYTVHVYGRLLGYQDGKNLIIWLIVLGM